MSSVSEVSGVTAQPFPIVGIGASAGGLAAFEAFFSGMSTHTPTGMAFVLVQHLSPDHESHLSNLIRRYTSMKVQEVEDGVTVEPDCAYIIPPNHDLAFLNGTLQLLPPSAPRGLRLSIDFFFRSLAADQRQRAICIVLSGTGSDGTLGARAVKGQGGMVIAQTPDSAAYDGMPRSVIATGLVDFVLPPAEMAAHLITYVDHVFHGRPRHVASPLAEGHDTLRKICVVLRDQVGHDFSQYKENTLVRRVERRLAIQHIDTLEDYLSYLQKTPSEVQALFRDLLIGVTRFFRDSEAFTALETQALPELIEDTPHSRPIRVWVCACSTGEEAYSIAITLQEYLEAHKINRSVQIFATDIDETAIVHARAGVYPASIAADVSTERLERFFVLDATSNSYCIRKSLRDMLIFSTQDVIRDPPFSRLDMLCCRNLLIYLGPPLQEKLIPLFHYALRPQGLLFLGSSESIGEFNALFEPLDRKWKLFRRRADVPGAARPTFGAFVTPTLPSRNLAHAPHTRVQEATPDLRRVTEQAMLGHYARAGILVNPHGEILHIHGRTGHYLEPAPGDASVSLLPMAREGLRRELTTALHKAVSTGESVSFRDLQVQANGGTIPVDLDVIPLADEASDLLLVLLAEADPTPPRNDPEEAPGDLEREPRTDDRVRELEQELRAKDEFLQTTLEEMETSNEELRSTNEEMQSVNEELQSTNEELQTSKEELQSVNEELATVNAELQQKVAALSRANNDMNNLLAGTGVGTLFVDHDLNILRFTPVTTTVINLIPTDVGRPIAHVVSNLCSYDRLSADIQTVLETLVPREIEVQTDQNAWYMMRIRPYRTLGNVIEGAVITFVETTERKHAEEALRTSEERYRSVVQANPDFMASLDTESPGDD